MMSLTRFPEGSLRELCSLAFPLMLSSLSVTTMIFIDRLLLAHYSSAALNAVTNAMTFGWAYLWGWTILTSISEVFVAQYNGAKLYHKMGEPIWQMIWLSLVSALFFFPLALGIENGFFQDHGQKLERDYLKWMFWFGPAMPLYGALCGFFIGQGKTRLVTCVAIATNLVNAGLDYLLIFGREGVIDSLGVEGAAIATSGSSIFQILILGAVFLKSSNRLDFGTSNYVLNLKLLWQCIRVGLPGAIFTCIELLGWAIFYRMMTQLGEHHITVASVSQSLIILFYFFADAISKSTTAIVGNLIGSQRLWVVSRVISSGLRLNFLFFCFLICFFYGFGDQIIHHFLPKISMDQAHSLKDSLEFCLFSICFFLLFEGIRFVFAGVLTAAGDTFFLLIGGTLSVWLLLILPIYYWVLLGQRSVEVAFLCCIFYSFSASLFYFGRYWSGKWKQLTLVSVAKEN